METPLSGVTSAAQHLEWRKKATRVTYRLELARAPGWTYSRRPFFPLTARR